MVTITGTLKNRIDIWKGKKPVFVTRHGRLLFCRKTGELPFLSLWKWGINFNEGYIGLSCIPFTIYFGTIDGGIFFYVSLFGRRFGRWLKEWER